MKYASLKVQHPLGALLAFVIGLASGLIMWLSGSVESAWVWRSVLVAFCLYWTWRASLVSAVGGLLGMAMMVRFVAPAHPIFFPLYALACGGAVLCLAGRLLHRSPAAMCSPHEGVMAPHGPAARLDADTSDPIEWAALPAGCSFSDLDGMSDIKARLYEAGKEIDAWGKAARSKAPARGAPRNGILLFGAPGNGKTVFAKALAGELKVPYIHVSCGTLASRWVGQETERVDQIFYDAVRQAPCLLLLDEFDAILIDRASVQQAESERSRLVNALLNHIEEARQDGVIIVATTNLRDRLDPAGIRAGRFDFHIEITAPDRDAREGLFARELREQLGRPLVLAEDLRTRGFQRWEGFSAAFVRRVAKEVVALICASGRPQGPVTLAVALAGLRAAQSGRGFQLPADTPTLAAMHYPPLVARSLDDLARLMENVDATLAQGGELPRGVLFYGPPGTGKTLGVQALAKTTRWNLLVTSGRTLVKDEAELGRVIGEASELRPCIIFIDEAEEILAERQAWDVRSPAAPILEAMDSAHSKMPDVMFIAATNHQDILSAAAMRGGRFTVKILFALPDGAVIARYVNDWLVRKSVRIAVPVAELSEALAPCALANVRELMQQGLNRMIARGGIERVITDDDLRDARIALSL